MPLSTAMLPPEVQALPAQVRALTEESEARIEAQAACARQTQSSIEELKTLLQIITKDDNRKDSIEIGTPAKGGAVKIYFDASKPEQAAELIENAIKMRAVAQRAIEREMAKEEAKQ